MKNVSNRVALTDESNMIKYLMGFGASEQLTVKDIRNQEYLPEALMFSEQIWLKLPDL